MKRSDAIRIAAAASAGALAGAALSGPSAAESLPKLPSTKGKPIVVAAIVGRGANVMDLAGAWEVFQDTAPDGWANGAFDLYTISDTRETLVATGGMKLVPMRAFADSDVPQPNVIFMGAQGDHTARKIAWIREASKKADVVMSVCTGAFLLAKTGLIDGMLATTHHEFFDAFAKRFPQVRLDRSARFVENPGGKYCSAGGITSGIELALRVVERYFGETAPARTAYYMEYTRSPKRPTLT